MTVCDQFSYKNKTVRRVNFKRNENNNLGFNRK